MRRHIVVAGLIASAIAVIKASPYPFGVPPMDPLGVGYTPTPSTVNAAGPTVTPEQASHAAQAKRAATLVAGIGLVSTTTGVPASGETAGTPARGVLGVAGATAEKVEASSWAKGSSTSTPRHRAPSFLFALVVETAGRRGILIPIFAALAEDESSWRPRARGRHGEIGLFQLKAATSRWCGGIDRFDPSQNADCAARYLYAQFERFGTWELALAAFKAGPERVPEAIPADSWAFVQRTLAKAEAYR